MQMIVDREGHNYYIPFFFMVAITIAIWCLIVTIENTKKYNAMLADEEKPLLSAPSSRVATIDVFRGMDICLMIFANYGAGQYKHALMHATWDGITLSDFAFPLFVL